MIHSTNVYLANENVYTKFCIFLSIPSQDIGQFRQPLVKAISANIYLGDWHRVVTKALRKTVSSPTLTSYWFFSVLWALFVNGKMQIHKSKSEIYSTSVPFKILPLKICNNEKSLLFVSILKLPHTSGHNIYFPGGNSDCCIADFT